MGTTIDRKYFPKFYKLPLLRHKWERSVKYIVCGKQKSRSSGFCLDDLSSGSILQDDQVSLVQQSIKTCAFLH